MNPAELQKHFTLLYERTGVGFNIQEKLAISRYLRALVILQKYPTEPTQLELFE